MRKQKEYEQLDLFSFSDYRYQITKPIRLIEFFAGVGFQRMGIEKALKGTNIGFESWRTTEWVIPSILAYDIVHNFGAKDTQFADKEFLVDSLFKLGVSVNYNEPAKIEQLKRMNIEKLSKIYNAILRCHNLVNIMNVKGDDLGITDTDKYEYILTYSFPCLVGNTMVLTDKGNKKLIDVKAGDYVLTHKGRYQKVLAQKETGTHETLVINAMAFDELVLTKNHYVLTDSGWKEAKDLLKKDKLAIAINQNSIIPNYKGIDFVWNDGRKSRHSQRLDLSNPDFWWLVGRYIGDGWLRQQGGIVICCAKNELSEITTKIDNLFGYSVVEERTVYKIHIPLKELGIYLEQFGRGAKNKHLTSDIFDLPTHLLNEFLNGYMSADGCFYHGRYQCNSVSKSLIYDIGQCVAKVYKRPFSIYKVVPPKTKVIEGRVVNQSEWYQLRLSVKNRSKGYYDQKNKMIFFPINKISEGKIEKVYDIEVEQDHTFIANSTIVHNCQDLSLAGNGEGMSVSQADGGTRSGLVWEVLRILQECKEKPQVLIMENVPQVHSKDNIDEFNKLQLELEKLGYRNFWKDINGVDVNVPQNRVRTFMVSIHDKDAVYSFPHREKLTRKLMDILEPVVDEKYFLTQKFIDYITGVNYDNEKFDRKKAFESKFESVNGEGISGTITTREGGRSNDTFVSEKIITVGNYGNGHHSQDVTDPKGLSPTITTGNHGLGQAIAIKNANSKGYELAEEGDGVDISSRMESHRGTVQKGRSQTLTCSGGENVGVVVRGTYQFAKSENFMQGKDRFQEGKDISDCLQTNQKEGIVVEVKDE